MAKINVPTKEEVSEQNQQIFDQVEAKVGFVPNLYATIAHSDAALGAYLGFNDATTKGSLSAKEREAISLVVSQVNSCNYCLSAHTAIAKMNGFTDEEAAALRKAESDDTKLAALTALAKEVTVTRGRPSEESVKDFFNAGYDKGSLIDVILTVGDTTITNLVNNVTRIPIDFPAAPDLTDEAAA